MYTFLNIYTLSIRKLAYELAISIGSFSDVLVATTSDKICGGIRVPKKYQFFYLGKNGHFSSSLIQFCLW